MPSPSFIKVRSELFETIKKYLSDIKQLGSEQVEKLKTELKKGSTSADEGTKRAIGLFALLEKAESNEELFDLVRKQDGTKLKNRLVTTMVQQFECAKSVQDGLQELIEENPGYLMLSKDKGQNEERRIGIRLLSKIFVSDKKASSENVATKRHPPSSLLSLTRKNTGIN